MVYDGFLLERDIRRWMSVSYMLDNNIRWLAELTLPYYVALLDP